MSDLWLTVAWSEEFREAPEFAALQRWVRTEAEQVWDRVVQVEDATAVVGRGYARLVISDRCLIGRRTLWALRTAIEAGAPGAAPGRLAVSGLPELERVRTLSGIERAESRVLAGDTGAMTPESPPYAAVLVSPVVAERTAFRAPTSILEGDGLPDGVVTAGLCHKFIDYYGQVREDILPFLDANCSDVLEVGCGRGATGAFLQKRLACRVTGVELNPVVAREAAKRLHRVIVGDIMEINPGVSFDAVVACELFEHLTDQEQFLQKLRGWLRPGGRAVLSVPNVGHYSIVEDLLAGRWDYLPIGLLCSTHYRFFTRRTLFDTLRAAGFSTIEIVSQPTEPPPWLDTLPADLEIDAENLSTQGFYVVVRVP